MHPQSGKYQTACATVQGHLEYSEVVVFRRYNKGERLGYQQQCLDTGKLGVVSWFEALQNASNSCLSPVASGTLPGRQAIYIGVACLNAQSFFIHEGYDHKQRDPEGVTSHP